ncbi:MAG: hypothetical protein J7J36_05030 [Thermoplasmata archaeon]|nr:hypothetical protein [Thermoplasmata archaeon]
MEFVLIKKSVCNLDDLGKTEREVLIKCAKLGMGISSNRKMESIIKRFPPRRKKRSQRSNWKISQKRLLADTQTKKENILLYTRWTQNRTHVALGRKRKILSGFGFNK